MSGPIIKFTLESASDGAEPDDDLTSWVTVERPDGLGTAPTIERKEFADVSQAMISIVQYLLGAPSLASRFILIDLSDVQVVRMPSRGEQN